MISNIIQIGNGVEICLTQQIEQEKKTGATAHIYKSKVVEIFANDDLELMMPTEAGKLVLLPLGVRFEFVFYSKTGLYRGTGLVKERYKTDNLYMIRVSLKSQLHKYQRREYYRMPCVIPMKFYDITLDQVQNTRPDRYHVLVDMPEVGMTVKEASIVDISGGGLRFVTDTSMHVDHYIIVEVELKNIHESVVYFLPTHILASEKSPAREDRYENRGEFIIRDRKVREEIIRFIFDEERKNRRNK